MKLPKKTTVWKTIFPQGTFSKSSSKDIESKIGRLSFKPIDNTLEEINSGFVSIFDKDKSVEETGISLGSTYGLHLRTDSRKIDKKGAKVHLEKEINQVFEGKVDIVNSPLIVINQVIYQLAKEGKLAEKNAAATYTFYISVNTDNIIKVAKKFFGKDIQLIEKKLMN